MAKPHNQRLPEALTEQHLANAILEMDRREQEALRLYRPRPEQMPFHVSSASERLVEGGNRSGKTACSSVEVASAALGQPLIGLDGKPLAHKYPKPPLVIWCVGFDERHIARMGRKLFKPGLFKIIQDENTGRWRTWKPWLVEDAAREADTKPSPPLIPERMAPIDGGGWAWENKAKGVFSVCRLTNGTEFFAFPSGSDAMIGDAVDLIWVDEDVTNPDIIPELQARLADVRGKFIWSSWPRVSNDALYRMHERAMDEAHKPDPDVFAIRLKFSDNPYIPPEAKAKTIRSWQHQGDAVVRARDQGEFVTDLFRVFPQFNIDVQGMPRRTEEPDKLEQALASHDWTVPPDWTWYLGVDPGHTHSAAIPLVIPPPQIGDYVVIPGEVYLENCDAWDMAEVLAQRWKHVRWEAFLIDYRAGRQTGMGLSTTTTEIYEKAFFEKGLKCVRTGHHFMWGSDDVAARNIIVRQWLVPRRDGSTKLRILTGECPTLAKHFRMYKKKVTKDDIKEDVVRRHNDTVDALAYAASHGVEWVPSEDSDWEPHDPITRFLSKMKMGRHDAPGDSFHMGSGAAPSNLIPA